MAENKANFKINRINDLKDLYSDEVSTRRRLNQSIGSSELPKNAAAVRDLLQKAITDRSNVVKLSKELYAKNPIYASIINYLSNMYMWRYTVTPHKTYKKIEN
jgi:hypothetical protein